MKIKFDDIDLDILKKACQRTFTYRNTEFHNESLINVLDKISKESGFVSRWNLYSKNNLFANGINFEDTLKEIYKLVELLFELYAVTT